MVEIKELVSENFCDFVFLLKQRGEMPQDFYEHKYLKQKETFFPSGYIAYLENKPVGCIGIVNKLYFDNIGVSQRATWFADWYVLNEVRGKGVGLELMKKVHQLSPYAFGIPGPKAAQLIAEKAGYIIQKNFFELTFPCSPFYYGFKLYKSFFLKNVIRGFKHLLKSEKIKKNKLIQIQEIDENFKESIFNNREASFFFDKGYLEWFMNMPEKDENKRKWYKVKDDKNWLILFIENDINNNRRARVIYVHLEENEDYVKFMKSIKHQLTIINVLYFQCYFYSNKKINISNSYIKAIPQSCSFNIEKNFVISIFDMESRWRDFIMN